jgi:chromosome segregation ATPase
MEFEQIVKRLEWLDEERRKDKQAIKDLGQRLANLDHSLSSLEKKAKSLDKNLSEVSTAIARLDQFDEILAKQRTDMSQVVADLEKKYQRREREANQRHQAQLDGINESLTNFKREFNPGEFKKANIALSNEDQRLNQAILELKQEIEEVLRSKEETAQSLRQTEDSHRQEAKRLTDVQGELASVRKRVDEHREKLELNTDHLRYLEGRVNEVLTSEVNRKQAQDVFIEQQTLAQTERERVWKDWIEQYENFKEQFGEIDVQLQSLEEGTRAAKRAQENFTELNQKYDRRINEVSEIQRLTEDRLRQEWVAFKSDDQKRWTAFTLSQEETLREFRKDIEKFRERLTNLDDAAQTLQDQLQQSTDTTEQQMQDLMNWAHEWLSAYERIMGHTRKAK